jgi:hypothetical protein
VTSTLRIALPRAAALTDVLLSSPGARVSDEEIATARRRLARELTSPLSEKRTRPIRVDPYRFQLALTSPDRLARLSGPFEPTPASCRRSIGVAAVARCVRDPSIAPAHAVGVLLDSATQQVGSEGFGAWWVDWYRKLPLAARSVVQAEATTWATQLFEALEWSRFETPPRLGVDLRWIDGESDVDVRAKVDVEVFARGGPAFFVVHTGTAGREWMGALALSALAAAMASGPRAVPSRVIGFWPASGQVRILPVEPGTLDRSSRLLVESVRVLRRFAPG